MSQKSDTLSKKIFRPFEVRILIGRIADHLHLAIQIKINLLIHVLNTQLFTFQQTDIFQNIPTKPKPFHVEEGE